jgi:hypothetical protein
VGIAATAVVFFAIIVVGLRVPRRAAAAAAVVAGLAFTTALVLFLPPGYYGLRAEFHRIPDPPGWASHRETAYGDSLCLAQGNSIERQLEPNIDDPQNAADAVTQILERRGYRLVSGTDSYNTRVFRRNKFKVTYRFEDGPTTYDYLLEIRAWFGC